MRRWYDPHARRWISEDPTGFAAGDANLYRYVANEPTGVVDPTGLEKNDIHLWVNATAAGTIPYAANKKYIESHLNKMLTSAGITDTQVFLDDGSKKAAAGDRLTQSHLREHSQQIVDTMSCFEGQPSPVFVTETVIHFLPVVTYRIITLKMPLFCHQPCACLLSYRSICGYSKDVSPIPFCEPGISRRSA